MSTKIIRCVVVDNAFLSNEKKTIPKEVFDFDHTIKPLLTRPLRSHSHLFGRRFTYKSESNTLAKIPLNVWSTRLGCLGSARGAWREQVSSALCDEQDSHYTYYTYYTY